MQVGNRQRENMTLIKAWREKKTRFVSGSSSLFGFHFMFLRSKLSHTSIFIFAEGKKKTFLLPLQCRSCRVSRSRNHCSAGLCRRWPNPSYDKEISVSFTSTEWNRFHSSKNSPDLNPDTTWPPDGVSALQDDSSEQGEVDGVHLEPLVPILIQGTPSSVVHIPVFNARLKTQVTQEGFFWGVRGQLQFPWTWLQIPLRSEAEAWCWTTDRGSTPTYLITEMILLSPKCPCLALLHPSVSLAGLSFHPDPN